MLARVDEVACPASLSCAGSAGRLRAALCMVTGVAPSTRSTRIIERKCAASGRTDFKFYQAFYLERRGSIDAPFGQ